MFEMIGRTAVFVLSFVVLDRAFKMHRARKGEENHWVAYVVLVAGALLMGVALYAGHDLGDCGIGWETRGGYADC